MTAPTTTEARWVLAPPPDAAAKELARTLKLHPLAATILRQRIDLADPEAAKTFLNPSLAGLLSPWDLPDMERAAERIAKAVRDKERVVVYGDYDSDGVSATAVLLHVFRTLGHAADYYLPSRETEGYGLSEMFVREVIQEKQFDLVITVDCGTADGAAVQKLIDAEIDVIVTDHHEIGDSVLPPALAVVNPKRADATYGFPGLVGAGIAYKLAWAVCERIHGSPKLSQPMKDILLALLPIVAVATITDVGALLGENRILVHFGLQCFRHGPVGLQALAKIARVDPEKVSVRDAGFGLGPRLNAAGRMGDADLALRLLIAQDVGVAKRFAEELDLRNSERRDLCRAIEEEAMIEVTKTHDLDNDAAIVVAREGWAEGIIGIVASRLVGAFHRPALVISLRAGADVGKGSARSVRGINLFAAMTEAKDHFVRFGGHEQAAGCSLMRSEIATVRGMLMQSCAAQAAAHNIEPQLHIDGEVSLAEISRQFIHEIARLAPFGHQNPEPIFMARGIQIAGDPRLMGKQGQHFSFNAAQAGTVCRAVVFNQPELLTEIDQAHTRWDIAFTCSENDYHSPPQPELRITAMQPTLAFEE